MEETIDSAAIIREAVGQDRGSAMRFLRYFNEGMGAIAITRQTLYKWRTGKSRPDKRILARAIEVYPAGDKRHELAAGLMGCVNVRA
jgi:hypothetical protein